MMNDNDTASKSEATIHILFVLGQTIVLIIHIQRTVKPPYLVQP